MLRGWQDVAMTGIMSPEAAGHLHWSQLTCRNRVSSLGAALHTMTQQREGQQQCQSLPHPPTVVVVSWDQGDLNTAGTPTAGHPVTNFHHCNDTPTATREAHVAGVRGRENLCCIPTFWRTWETSGVQPAELRSKWGLNNQSSLPQTCRQRNNPSPATNNQGNSGSQKENASLRTRNSKSRETAI